MEPNNTSPSNNSSNSNKFGGLVQFDFPWIFARIQEVMFNPKGCWDIIKAEALDTKDLFGRYLIPLVLVSAICGFIGSVFIGINVELGTFRVPLVSGLIFAIFSLGSSLASFFVTAFIVEKLAPKFETQVSLEQALRLVGFAATPGLLAGILSIAPGGLMSMVAFMLSIYSCYLFWVGFQPLTAVSDSRRIAYFVTTMVCSMLALIVLFGITASLFAPVLPSGSELEEMKQLQRNIQNMIPASGR